jgi:hypothetical protein
MTEHVSTNGHVREFEASTPRVRRADAERDLHMLSLLNGGGLLPPATIEAWFRMHPSVEYLRPLWLSLESEVG